MYFSERVLALTQDALLPKVVDNVLGSNILSLRLIGRGKKGKGTDIKKAIKYQNSGAGTSFSGLDTFTASQLNTKVRMSYDMRGVRQPVAISGMEAVANSVSETQVTDLVKEAVEETEQELMDLVGTQLYGNGTGNSNKDLIGINAIVDDGTEVSTIGALSRTTYPVLNATRTASGGTLSLSALSTLESAVSSGSGMTTPTLKITTETVWDLYEQLLVPTVRETYSQMGYYKVGMGDMQRGEGLSGTHGFTALSHKGNPVVKDEKATAQTWYTLNENWLDWYGWNAAGTFGYQNISLGSTTIEGQHAEPPMSQNTGFNWSGLRAPDNQFGGIADIILLGNLTSFQPRRQGRLTGIQNV
jgi:hypothetical protein